MWDTAEHPPMPHTGPISCYELHAGGCAGQWAGAPSHATPPKWCQGGSARWMGWSISHQSSSSVVSTSSLGVGMNPSVAFHVHSSRSPTCTLSPFSSDGAVCSILHIPDCLSEKVIHADWKDIFTAMANEWMTGLANKMSFPPFYLPWSRFGKNGCG